MEVLIWAGAAVSVTGLLGLLWCIVKVVRARRAGLSDADLRSVLQSVLPVNMAALLFSVLGLMMVVVGIFLS